MSASSATRMAAALADHFTTPTLPAIRTTGASSVTLPASLITGSAATAGVYGHEGGRSMIYLSGVVSPRTEALAGSLPHFGVMCQPDSNVYLHRSAYQWHAADNACFAGNWTEAKWLRWLGAVEPSERLLFATVPDVVSNWEATNYRWTSYASKVKRLGLPLAYVAQDGVIPERIPWTELDCLFVGGSTNWKLSEDAFRLARLAKERGKWTHMGRVNSWFRLKCAALAGYDSCDGNVLAYDPPRLDKLLGWLQRLDDEQFLALEWPA